MEPRRPPPPPRISLRLAARLLRLPLKGGVIGVQTGNRVYTLPGDRARRLVQASTSLPPWGGVGERAEPAVEPVGGKHRACE